MKTTSSASRLIILLNFVAMVLVWGSFPVAAKIGVEHAPPLLLSGVRFSLAFSIMARRVPKRIYASDGDFQNTLAAAQYSPVKFTMRARRSDAFSRVARI